MAIEEQTLQTLKTLETLKTLKTLKTLETLETPSQVARDQGESAGGSARLDTASSSAQSTRPVSSLIGSRVDHSWSDR